MFDTSHAQVVALKTKFGQDECSDNDDKEIEHEVLSLEYRTESGLVLSAPLLGENDILQNQIIENSEKVTKLLEKELAFSKNQIENLEMPMNCMKQKVQQTFWKQKRKIFKKKLKRNYWH